MATGTFKTRLLEYLASAAAMFAIFFLGCVISWFVFGGKTPATKTETVLVRDTVTLEKPLYVEKVRTVTVVDTLLQVVHDTVKVPVAVEIPIDYSKAEYRDAEIWYHGYRAAIDSVRLYPKTYVVTKEVDKSKNLSRWSLGISGGYGVGKSGLTPYIGVGVTYDLVRIPKFKRRERTDYE